MCDDSAASDRLALDPVFIPVYLRAASPLQGESETARSEAVRKLHQIYRNQLATGGRIGFQLFDFFREQADRIWASDDPVLTMDSLFGTSARRGAPVRNEDRDFEICVLIRQRVNSGEDLEDVVIDLEESGSSGRLSSGRLKNIYQARDDRLIVAEVAFRAIHSSGGT